ncbi:GGDEF domain-containing protein [Anoxynatronum buryatiense]|nr:GGDEF domain-containing protein [Anoxynatronum buryatiense]
MKRDGKIILALTLVIAVVLTAVFAYFISRTEKDFDLFYTKQMDNHASLIRKTVNLAESYTETYTRLINEDLYHRLYGLNQELAGVAADQLTPGVLMTYRDNYDLAGLAIFSPVDDEDIAISASTVLEEIGERTAFWGYWHEAFSALLQGETPNVGRGYTRENFWVGPRSRSHYMEGYYRFAYYHNEAQGYLINGYIEDAASYDDNIRNLMDDLFAYLDEEISYIQSSSLIDLNAWEVAYHNEYSNPEDPAFIYGNFDRNLFIQLGLTPEELYAMTETQRHVLKADSGEALIYLIPAGVAEHPYLVAALIDDSDHWLLRENAGNSFLLMGLIALVIVLLGVSFVMHHYRSQLTFEIERKEASEAFARSIAALPEFIYRCQIAEDNTLLLTYNDGRSVGREQAVAMEKHYLKMNDIYPETYTQILRENVEKALAGVAQRFEVAYNGRIYEHYISRVENENEVAGFATDITEKRHQEEKARYRADHDSLTELKNRGAFELYIREITSRKPSDSYALFFMDLDHFKEVNDTYGHLLGDHLLRAVANQIRQAVAGSEGILARVGGDEFAFFFRESSKEVIEKTAENIIAGFQEPLEVEGQLLTIGVSVGIARYPQDSANDRELIHFADQAMYAVKHEPGKKYAFHRKHSVR